MCKITYVSFLLCILSSLSACSSNVPACSDPESKDLVVEIVKDEITNNFGQARADQLYFSLDAIRTTDENAQTGAFDCAADLVSNEGVSHPITYTVEVTDDGHLYVTVYGL